MISRIKDSDARRMFPVYREAFNLNNAKLVRDLALEQIYDFFDVTSAEEKQRVLAELQWFGI